ncbi:signal peptidase I [Candidatus Albibeggiatoa sp. nov. BB20]|uniref:signal peptidase I n=1 Tax=Candidatus Albibeggiatoa sp. nov. BB20 TaxID=3162723 RepID=UPI0033654AC6
MNSNWNWDLATILVICIFVSGVIWLFDAIFFAPKRRALVAKLPAETSDAVREKAESVPLLVDLSKSLLPVFLIVLILRSFLVEPFRIPSGSMMPTLLVGDFILVNKFAYGIRLPVLNTKVLPISEPERGDVVVFRYPEDPTTPFIKRVVGLPGDTVHYNRETKHLYINGEIVSQEKISTYHGVGSGSNMTGADLRVEHLPNAEHQILVVPKHPTPIVYNQFVLPEGQYFVLGDNRDNSRDSRYWGTVPEQNLIGKAFFIWMNLDWSNGGVSWDRLGTKIK